MQGGNSQRTGNNRKFQNFRVEDLRLKLNRMREQRALEGGDHEPPPDPGYNYLRDPSREYEPNYHRPNYRGKRGHHPSPRQRGGKPHQDLETGQVYSKESAAFRKEFNQGRTVNIKVELETDTGNRTCSVEQLPRGAVSNRRGRGNFRVRFNSNPEHENVAENARGRGRGRGRSRGFYRGRFRGRNNRSNGSRDDNANQTQSSDEYWDDNDNDKVANDEHAPEASDCVENTSVAKDETEKTDETVVEGGKNAEKTSEVPSDSKPVIVNIEKKKESVEK